MCVQYVCVCVGVDLASTEPVCECECVYVHVCVSIVCPCVREESKSFSPNHRAGHLEFWYSLQKRDPES